jgi:two-component system NtrC family sensor kinase
MRPLEQCVGPQLAGCLNEIQYPLNAPIEREITDAVIGGPYVVTITDLIDRSGRHSGRVVIARDLVPLIALREREELRSRLLQSEKLAALGHFVAGIAHELNNPLQSVLGHLELLRATGAFPSTIKSEIRTVLREADRAAKIVRNLLVFAGSGRVRLRRASLNGIVQKVLSQRKAACRAEHIEVVRHYDQHLPRILVDPVLLHQVFLNVVLNAEQAIAATGTAGRIEIRTTVGRDGQWVAATFRDTGAGISDDTLPRIFEPFYTTRDVGQGTGLGLALAYGIVQEHGGRIAATNHPDGGAVFTVELPIA